MIKNDKYLKGPEYKIIMVRIFAAGDFHGDKQSAKQLADRAVKEKADIIILNGDIVEEDNTQGIMHYFKKTGKPVFLVPGNHDHLATDFLAEQYNAQNINGKIVQYKNVEIIGCEGQTEKEIYDNIKKARATAQKTLLVAHIHPAGTLMEKFSQIVRGSTTLRKAIEKTKPDAVVCGHVHEAEGIEEKIGNTTVINAGKKGKIIEL